MSVCTVLHPFILKVGIDTVPASVAELSGRRLRSSSVGFTGLIAQREHQAVACCSDVSQLPMGCCSVLCEELRSATGYSGRGES